MLTLDGRVGYSPAFRLCPMGEGASLRLTLRHLTGKVPIMKDDDE